MTNTGGRSRRDRGKQWTEAEARLALVACAQSGLSVRAFSMREGLHPKRLYWWMKRLGLRRNAEAVARPEARRRKRAAESPLGFVPVVVKRSSATAHIVIRREGSTTMEIDASAAVSPAWVAAVMIELERAGCS